MYIFFLLVGIFIFFSYLLGNVFVVFFFEFGVVLRAFGVLFLLYDICS